MQPFSSISAGYRRWRHSKGFGVHSPFAYRFVRDVVSAKGCYYASARLSRLIDSLPRAARREYSMLFRMVARLAPHHIVLSESADRRLTESLRLADTRLTVATCGSKTRGSLRTMTILTSSELRQDMPANLLDSGNMLVIRNLRVCPAVLAEAMNQVRGGWIFADKDIAVIISDDAERLNYTDIRMI